MRLVWDASGLAKRYVPEVGTATVVALWQSLPIRQMAATFTVYAETYSILLRKYNRGEISASALAVGQALLRSETVNHLDFSLLAVDTADILAGIDLMERHQINSSDAAILAVYLRYAPTTDDVCVIVTADRRLLRAAHAEGLQTLNPERIAPADVPGFLAGL